ncbi:MAG: hypothetical protein K9H16_03640 [Bacteroidales bacterium]|nr:hypothetical protein [Bacteroidales bacterium]
MKKAAVIFILCVIMFQMIGVFLLFKLKQNQIRQEVKMQLKAGVSESELTIFSFCTKDANTIKWVDDNEFVYHDQMYDVVKTLKIADQTVYYCLPDYEETRLFAKLNIIVAGEMGKDKTNSGKRIKIFVNWFYSEALPPGKVIENDLKNIQTPYCLVAVNRVETPETPPPRRLFSNM